MLVGLGGLLIALFIATMAVSQVRSVTTRTLPSVGHFFNVFDLLGAVSANTMLFTLIYRVLPKRRVHWQDAVRGGLLAAIVWEVGRDLLGAFFIGMRYTTAYGAIGSFIALLLWCYYGISILFFGAEYVQVLELRRRGGGSEKLMAGARLQPVRSMVLESPTNGMRRVVGGKFKPRRVQ
jgi:membrane protein